jgi:hypothetical protein
MKRHKATLLELCLTNQQSVFGEVREIEFQGFGNPEASAGDKRQQGRVRDWSYRLCWSQLASGSEETIDFVLSEDVTRPTTLGQSTEEPPALPERRRNCERE